MNSTIDERLMSPHQLQTELLRCEYCEEKPCKEACPVNCSPFDFIMAARQGHPSDIKRAAGEIMSSNPLGGVCGLVCPDRFCMAACSRKKFDGSINIPKVQATLVEMAKRLGGIPKFSNSCAKREKGRRHWRRSCGPGSCFRFGAAWLRCGHLRKPRVPWGNDEPDPRAAAGSECH